MVNRAIFGGFFFFWIQTVTCHTLWILKSGDSTNLQKPPTVDLLKCLVSQAVRLNVKLHTESSMSQSCMKFQTAMTEDEWVNVLGSVLAGLPHLYIVVDVETLGPAFADINADFSWPSSFLNLFRGLTDRGIQTQVQVMLISYGSEVFAKASHVGPGHLVVNMGRSRKSPSAQRRKAASNRMANSFMHASRGHGRGVSVRNSSFARECPEVD
jgi:hypothetical protein